MDNKIKQPSAISDQSSDQTDESATLVEDAKIVEQEAKSESDSSVIPSVSEESQDLEARDPSPAKPDQDDKKEAESETTETKTDAVSEPTTDEPTTSDTPTPKPDPSGARWYVVHTYSGHENKVAHTLKQRVESEHLEKKILDVLVPMQDKIEIKSGKKINIKEKIFPGYILVKMVLDDISWLAVRTTQGVTSFVGMGNKPTPISDAEVASIVKFTQTEAPMYKQVFAVNDAVKIVDGPFADFIGKIDSIDGEKGKVRVLVSIFGRETPVELDFLQIKKI